MTPAQFLARVKRRELASAYLFLGGEEPRCLDASDINDDGRLDITDGAFLLQFLYLDEEFVPPAPGIPDFPCGPDTQLPGTPGHLGCKEYQGCGI